jgi:hypothetical protein
MKLVTTRWVVAELTDQQFKRVVGDKFCQALNLRPADFELSNGKLTVHIGHCLLNKKAKPFEWSDKQQEVWIKTLADFGIESSGLSSLYIGPDSVALTFNVKL